MTVRIRPNGPGDAALLVRLIRGLAEYERMTDQCVATEEALAEHLFGPRPCAEAFIAEDDAGPAGYAIFHPNFSTFRARPGIWLEDLFVLPDRRGRGIGRALLARVAAVAAERGCLRLEWSVLDWNKPAIRFYGAIGASVKDEWRICRLEGEALGRLAGS